MGHPSEIQRSPPGGDQDFETILTAPEAEDAVLGGLLVSGAAFDRIAHLVRPDHFYTHDRRAIFRAICGLIDDTKPVDVLTVAEKLRGQSDKAPEGGWLRLLQQMVNDTPGAGSIVAYAELVRAAALRRALLSASNQIGQLAYARDGRDAADLIDAAGGVVTKLVDSASSGNFEEERMPALLTQVMNKLDELHRIGAGAVSGLPTGFVDLDVQTTGLHGGDLVIIGGRPSMGKTSLAMNIVEHCSVVLKRPALVFSMEMPPFQLALRTLASTSGVHMQRVRTGRLHSEDWDRLGLGLAKLNQAPIRVIGSYNLTPFELRAKARQVRREMGDLGVIMVDYIQLMQGGGDRSDSRADDVSAISRALKLLAIELDVPVVALSQLNRGLENRPNKRPRMADLRESGSIEQDGDLILFVYRDEVYDENSADKGVAEIIIAKQRNGPIGTVKLSWLQHSCSFTNYAGQMGYG